MTGQEVGYIRVSAIDQNTTRQLDGIHLDKTFTEKCSAATRKRPELQRCIEHLREGDTLHVHSIDRLARNLSDLQNIVNELTGQGIAVHFHTENLSFSGEDDPMKQLMLQLMGAFAEFERSMIKARQREGIAAAKKAGKRIGAPPALNDNEKARVREMQAQGHGVTEIAKKLGVSRNTVYRALKD